MTHDRNTLKSLGAILIIFLLAACAKQNDENIKWTAKYDFIDLYKTKVNNGFFNPGSAITIWRYSIPSSDMIILGAEKTLSDFSDNPKDGSVAAVFVSKDRGKSYQEILLTGEKVEDLETSEGKTLITTNQNGFGPGGKDMVFILTHDKQEIKKIDEYDTSSGGEHEISYYGLNGDYLIKNIDSSFFIINWKNINEKYEVPQKISGNNTQFYNIGNKEIIYMKGQEILKFNVENLKSTVYKKLVQSYDYFFKVDDNILLYKTVFERGEKYKYLVYDINENFLYEETEKDREVYRYRNFACDYSGFGPKPIIRYSYDYGKTWKVENVSDFAILQSRVGFYKDQFLVTEGIFFHGESPEGGGRVMVGEFVK